MMPTQKSSRKPRSNIKTLWLKDLPEEKRDGFVQLLKNDNFILPALTKIIDQLIESNCRLERSESMYENPNWSHKQAHINGYIQACKQIKDLINVSSV